MNEAHVHVAINHFPVVGSVIGMLIIMTGLFKKNESIIQVALWLFAVLALITIPVLLTGNAAKEMMEQLPGVGEELIERHEGLANITFWLLMGTGVLSITQLFFFRTKKYTGKFTLLICFLAILVSGSAGLTANAGGKIIHSEFENGIIESDENITDEELNIPEKEKGKHRKRKGEKIEENN